VYDIAVRMVFHPQDAEEVTQEGFVKAVTHLGTFRGGSAFRTWLYCITANHALNMKRRSGDPFTPSPPPPPPSTARPTSTCPTRTPPTSLSPPIPRRAAGSRPAGAGDPG
jgi:DNA-directed RNA polymerase specialized sigma24 family protein